MKSPYLGLLRLTNPAHQPSAVAYVHRCSSSGDLELLLESLRTAYSVDSLALLIIADKERAQGEDVKRCRRGERERAKGGGWRSLAYTRWSGGRVPSAEASHSRRCCCCMRYALRTLSVSTVILVQRSE